MTRTRASSTPTGREIFEAADGRRKTTRRLHDVQAALKVSPRAGAAVFTPQPYPLFFADWSNGEPLVGRIIGWSASPGSVPEPVVVFEDHGSTSLPLRVNMELGTGGGGPMWIRDSFTEAEQVAAAYVPPTRRMGSR